MNATSAMLHSSYASSDEENALRADHAQSAISHRRTLSIRSPSNRSFLSRASSRGRSLAEGRDRPRRATVVPDDGETARPEEGGGGRDARLYTTTAAPWVSGKAPVKDDDYKGDQKYLGKKRRSFLDTYFPIMNPRHKWVIQWNRFIVFAVLVAIFVDPLFLYLLMIEEENKCVSIIWSLAAPIAIARTVTDVIYVIHILLKFRMAYVAPESTVIGAGVLVDDSKKIASRYLRRDFMLDITVVLPVPQVILWVLLPRLPKLSSGNSLKLILGPTNALQSIPRVIKFMQLLDGRSTSGHIFESAWSSFVINILMYVVAGHLVGVYWYILGLQRVLDCLTEACAASGIASCSMFMDCGDGSNVDIFEKMPSWQAWVNDNDSTACYEADGSFGYGIYQTTVNLAKVPNLARRYLYSLCWGFLQLATLAGNQITSYYEWEVSYTILMITMGLLLFAWLLGNMQNVLQAMGRRRLQMQIRQRDVENWMCYRRLPERLRRQVRRAERFNWVATRGVNEEDLLENLPEDIQREVRRHFFEFVKKVRIFTVMDERILDAIRARLRQKFYIKRSNILYQGGPLEKMFFIVRGHVESIGADGSVVQLSEGDVVGEELLTWYLEHPYFLQEPHLRRGHFRFQGMHLFSSRTVRCLTNIEAFELREEDIEEVALKYPRLLRNPRLQRAIRYESPYWRDVAATQIQVAWRYRQRRLKKKQSGV